VPLFPNTVYIHVYVCGAHVHCQPLISAIRRLTSPVAVFVILHLAFGTPYSSRKPFSVWKFRLKTYVWPGFFQLIRPPTTSLELRRYDALETWLLDLILLLHKNVPRLCFIIFSLTDLNHNQDVAIAVKIVEFTTSTKVFCFYFSSRWVLCYNLWNTFSGDFQNWLPGKKCQEQP